MSTRRACRLVAFYLPQYHPIPENNAWWGHGFTEWINVAKARPLFPGHYQPHLPADLGFYDLRVPEVRAAQAALARQYGVEAFCYYHYWFAGKRLLERPFEEVLRSGEPNFPFCLCWANETWRGKWHGAGNRVLIEQTYPGLEDARNHFKELLRAFTDARHLLVDGRPVFVIYAPESLPNAERTTDLWRELAERAGLKGLYLVAMCDAESSARKPGFDAILMRTLPRALGLYGTHGLGRLLRMARRALRLPFVVPYSLATRSFRVPEAATRNVHPCVIPNWDNTPRCLRDGLVLLGSTPELFRKHLKAAIDQVASKPPGERLVFIKSWNEWAEGNYLEPDLQYGKAYLEVVKTESERT